MPDLPLSGIRVVDLSQVYAGPTCARILCDLGAEVIKVEGLHRIDVTRSLLVCDNETQNDYWNRTHYFLLRNAGKKSLTLDFQEPRSIELLKRLLAQADVVVESFTPRVLAQHGLDYQSLRKLRPDLIMISLSGYGQTGPWRDYAAYGMGLEPASGISAFTGYRGGDPLRSGISFTDPYTGIMGAGAVLAALHYRQRTGRGQLIDLSQQEGAIALLGPALMDYQWNGRVAERLGNRSSWAAPQGCYRCRGDDNWLVLTVRDDAEWQAFCGAAGHPEWTEADLGTNAFGQGVSVTPVQLLAAVGAVANEEDAED
jgi:benzylsuccinate CoA-transferase BbsF subunit